MQLGSIRPSGVLLGRARTGSSPPVPNLFGRGAQAIGSFLSAPRAGLAQLRKRVGGVQRLWWRLEDLAVDGGKFAVKFAFKAARPVLVGEAWHHAAAPQMRPAAAWRRCIHPRLQ